MRSLALRSAPGSRTSARTRPHRCRTQWRHRPKALDDSDDSVASSRTGLIGPGLDLDRIKIYQDQVRYPGESNWIKLNRVESNWFCVDADVGSKHLIVHVYCVGACDNMIIHRKMWTGILYTCFRWTGRELGSICSNVSLGSFKMRFAMRFGEDRWMKSGCSDMFSMFAPLWLCFAPLSLWARLVACHGDLLQLQVVPPKLRETERNCANDAAGPLAQREKVTKPAVAKASIFTYICLYIIIYIY
jgi:hypothetical protein